MNAMYRNNPVLRLTMNALGVATFAGYLAIVALIAIVCFTITMLPVAAKVAFGATFTALAAFCIIAYVFGEYAIEHAKLIGLCALVVAAVVLVFAVPQVAVGVVLVLVFAEATK